MINVSDKHSKIICMTCNYNWGEGVTVNQEMVRLQLYMYIVNKVIKSKDVRIESLPSFSEHEVHYEIKLYEDDLTPDYNTLYRIDERAFTNDILVNCIEEKMTLFKKIKLNLWYMYITTHGMIYVFILIAIVIVLIFGLRLNYLCNCG